MERDQARGAGKGDKEGPRDSELSVGQFDADLGRLRRGLLESNDPRKQAPKKNHKDDLKSK